MGFEKLFDLLNNLPWGDMSEFVAVISSWVTFTFLLVDRATKKRPHMEITVELLRSSLACLVIRNTGEVPLSLRKLKFDKSFVSQLPTERKDKFINNRVTDMVISPGKFWVICLDTTIPEIIDKYSDTVIKVEYCYSGLYKKKMYCGKTYIDFKQYADCLVYISDIYELVEENKRVVANLKAMHKDISILQRSFIEYADLSSNFIKRFSVFIDDSQDDNSGESSM